MKIRAGAVLFSVFLSFANDFSLVGPGSRAAFQKDEGWDLRLHGETQRIQLHDHIDTRRCRADR